MKRITYSLLLLMLFASCGPSYPLNYARIEFKDSKSDNYSLISGNDSSLVVTRLENSKDSLEIIPLKKIDRIFLQQSTAAAEWLGFFGGLAIGMGVRQLVESPYERSHDDGLGGIVVVPFIPIGVLIGNKITDKLKEIDLYGPDGKELLRSMLQYRNIPNSKK